MKMEEEEDRVSDIALDAMNAPTLIALKKIGDLWLDGKMKVNKPRGATSHSKMMEAVDLDSLPMLDMDRAQDSFYSHAKVPPDMLTELTLGMAKIFPECSIILSGNFEYPVNGYMGWHTNSAAPGLRMYASYATGNSAFRYIREDGDGVDSMDDLGWNLRLFDVNNKNPLWHCVWAESPRLSIGFRIINNL